MRMMNAYTDCEPSVPLLEAMSDWEKYALCNEACYLNIYFDPYQEYLEYKTVQQRYYIVIDCDHQMINCSVPLWKCGIWPREENELRFIQMVKETLIG